MPVPLVAGAVAGQAARTLGKRALTEAPKAVKYLKTGVPQIRRSAQDFVQRMPGLRNQARDKFLSVARPLHSFARTGVNYAKKFDKAVAAASMLDIPGVSDRAQALLENPDYVKARQGVYKGEELLDKGVSIANKVDKISGAGVNVVQKLAKAPSEFEEAAQAHLAN